jgi:acyl-CoA synthetase (AMP-forming)/AMP-acid ligase II
MPNRIDLVVHYLACFKAGLVATPLNYRYTYREIDLRSRSAAPTRCWPMSSAARTWPRARWQQVFAAESSPTATSPVNTLCGGRTASASC